MLNVKQKNKIRSGGVKTLAGKNISKYNAQKHMILRQSISEYEEVDYKELCNDLMREWRPSGRTQECLIEIIAVNMIKLTRLVKSEAELIKHELSPYTPPAHDDEFDMFKPGFHEYDPKLTYTEDVYGIYARYQTAIENRVYRAIKALRELKEHEQN